MTDIPLHHLHHHLDQDGLPYKIVKIEDIWQPDQHIAPDRHSYYALFWVKEGQGQHLIDFEEYTVRDDSLFFIAPGQVHYWQIEGSFRGYAILFLRDLFDLDNLTTDFLQTIDVFQGIQYTDLLYPRASFVPVLDSLAAQLWAESEHPDAFGQLTAVRALLHLILIHAQRCYLAQIGPSQNQEEQMVHQFLKLVRQHAITDHSVQAYADRLGVTAGYLSELVKAELGQPAGKAIRQQLVLEAKRLLIHSEQTVHEIAYQLNFADSAYFSRFFKREAKQSPTAFRTNFRKKYLTTHR